MLSFKQTYLVIVTCLLSLLAMSCGKVLDVDDPVAPPLLSLDLTGFVPSRNVCRLSSNTRGFLDPMEIIALADNPRVALVWLVGLDMPFSNEWAYDEVEADTVTFQAENIEFSWPFRMHIDITAPPALRNLQYMKAHPESKAGIASILVFNDANDNGKLDELVLDSVFNYVCWGPYDYNHFNLPCPTSPDDTVYSDSLVSLTHLQKDWTVAYSINHLIVYATDERACEWLNATYSGREILDREVDIEVRFAYRYMDSTSVLSKSVQHFKNVTPGYSVVKAQKITEYVADFTIPDRKVFDTEKKRWKRYLLDPQPYEKFLQCETFVTIDPSAEEVPILVSDDIDELWYYWIVDG